MWRGSDEYFKKQNYNIKGTINLALQTFFCYAFKKDTNLQALLATIDVHNQASQSTLSRLGFEFTENIYRRKNKRCKEMNGGICKKVAMLMGCKNFFKNISNSPDL